MLGQIDALPGAEREFASITGTCSDTPVSMAFTCAGMSSGPSTSCTQPASAGARRSSAVRDRSARQHRRSPGSPGMPTCGGDRAEHAVPARRASSMKRTASRGDLGEALARASRPRASLSRPARAQRTQSWTGGGATALARHDCLSKSLCTLTIISTRRRQTVLDEGHHPLEFCIARPSACGASTLRAAAPA